MDEGKQKFVGKAWKLVMNRLTTIVAYIARVYQLFHLKLCF